MLKTRVLIADDHELVRLALKTMLEDEKDIEVVGEAGDAAEAIAGCRALTPDVLVLDMRMPGGGGVEICRRVRETSPATNVMVLTSFDEDEELFGALSAGACGYLLKDTRPERIVSAIRAVAEGQVVFDSAVANRVIAGKRESGDSLADRLSSREMDVLQLMAKGLTNKEIAQTLWIGETTVKTHVSHILHKLGRADRTQAVLTAVKMGIVALEH